VCPNSFDDFVAMLIVFVCLFNAMQPFDKLFIVNAIIIVVTVAV